MSFKDILGNERAKNILSRALTRGKVPHSLLFYGPKGVGKKETALTLAKAMICLNGDKDSCEKCRACRAVNKEKHPDVIEIIPKGGSFKIDEIRNLKKAAYLKPLMGKKRFFLIEQAEKMREDQASTLLKVLEEPPDFTHIILITTAVHLILPTIRSRCQMISFSSIPRDAIHKFLLEKGLEKEKARLISLLVRGDLRKAIDFNWDKAQSLREKSWNIYYNLVTGKEVSSFIKEFWFPRNKLKEELEEVLGVIASFCRDLLLIKENGKKELLINFDYKEKLEKLGRGLSKKVLLKELGWVYEALEGVDRNLNTQIIVHTFFSHFTRV